MMDLQGKLARRKRFSIGKMIRNVFFKGKSPPQAKNFGVSASKMMNLQGKSARRRPKKIEGFPEKGLGEINFFSNFLEKS